MVTFRQHTHTLVKVREILFCSLSEEKSGLSGIKRDSYLLQLSSPKTVYQSLREKQRERERLRGGLGIMSPIDIP